MGVAPSKPTPVPAKSDARKAQEPPPGSQSPDTRNRTKSKDFQVLDPDGQERASSAYYSADPRAQRKQSSQYHDKGADDTNGPSNRGKLSKVRVTHGHRLPYRQNKQARPFPLQHPIHVWPEAEVDRYVKSMGRAQASERIVSGPSLRVYFPLGRSYYIQREFRSVDGFNLKKVVQAMYSTTVTGAATVIRDANGPKTPITRSALEHLMSQIVITGFAATRDQIYMQYDIYQPHYSTWTR